MKNDQVYPMGKLSMAIEKLALHPGRVKERLKESMSYGFAQFSPGAFSDDVQRRHEEIWEIITSVPEEEATEREGVLSASINKLDEDEAEELAHQIYSLYITVLKEYR